MCFQSIEIYCTTTHLKDGEGSLDRDRPAADPTGAGRGGGKAGVGPATTSRQSLGYLGFCKYVRLGVVVCSWVRLVAHSHGRDAGGHAGRAMEKCASGV